MKTCSGCGETKPFEEFHKFAKAPDGLQYRCKACGKRYRAANKERIRQSAKDWRAANPERARAYGRAHYARNKASLRAATYSMSEEEWNRMLAAQGGKCAICDRSDPQSWHTDHDHACCPGSKSCGACVRGILCPSCNTGLGRFGDSPEQLQRAIDYLTASR